MPVHFVLQRSSAGLEQLVRGSHVRWLIWDPSSSLGGASFTSSDMVRAAISWVFRTAIQAGECGLNKVPRDSEHIELTLRCRVLGIEHCLIAN